MPRPEPGGGHEATRPSRSFARRDRFPARGIRVAGEAMKKGRQKTAAPKRHDTPKRARHRKPAADGLNKKVGLLRRELNDALQQQTATADILKVISHATFNLQVVLDAIATAAARLLDIADADIMRVEGHSLVYVAKHGPSQQWPIGSRRAINRNWVTGRAVFDRATI